METVLEVRNLTKTFPKRGSREALEAVADVSFRIEPGECLAVSEVAEAVRQRLRR